MVPVLLSEKKDQKERSKAKQSERLSPGLCFAEFHVTRSLSSLGVGRFGSLRPKSASSTEGSQFSKGNNSMV